MPGHDRTRWVRLTAIALALYWIAMFLGTHLPNPPSVVTQVVSDTWLHAVAYFGLGGLLSLVVATRRSLDARTAAMLLVIAIVYGALDELLQMIPFLHRTAEWKDFAADAVGAACGVGLGLLLCRGLPRQPAEGSAAGAAGDPDR